MLDNFEVLGCEEGYIMCPVCSAEFNSGTYCAIDTECTGIDLRHSDRPFAVSGCNNKGDIYYWSWKVDPFTRKVNPPKSVKKEIQSLIDRHHTIVFHHANFDISALATIGITVPYKKVEDTLLASHVLDNLESHSLDLLALKYLDVLDDTTRSLREETIRARAEGKRRGWTLGVSLQGRSEVPRDYWMVNQIDPASTLLQEYSEQDARNTALLWDLFSDQLSQQGLYEQYEYRMSLLPIVYEMEQRGVTVSKQRIEMEKDRYEKAANARSRYLEDVGSTITKDKDFNPNSGKQTSKILHDHFGLPILYVTKTGQPSTDKVSLKELLDCATTKSEKFLHNLIEMKKHYTASRYLAGYQQCMKRDLGNRLYPSINVTGTVTTRFSSSNPNSQNVGKGDEWKTEHGTEEDFRLRDVFGPMTGRVWYAIDYSQLQLRIFAYASQEESLIQAFKDGYDFHQYVACRIFDKDPEDITAKERRTAKNVNFGIIFGAGESKIDNTSGVPGLYRTFKSLFPSVDSYMKSVTKQVTKTGYVKTLGGYRLGVDKSKPYIGVNYIVQGTEGEIVQDAMIRCHQRLATASPNKHIEAHQSPYMCMQVHDELVFDFPKDTFDEGILYLLERDMEKSGESVGVETPVNIEVINHYWSKGIPWRPSSIPTPVTA